MANCVTCDASCERAGPHRVKTDCISYVPKVYPKPRTNYDSIVSKSPEDLAKWLSFLAPCCHCEAVPEERNQVIHPHNCYEKWLEWLKQEVQE